MILASELNEYVIPRVFLAIAVVIVVARLMGTLARLVRQPPVVGEIIGGILLGPTLLGAFPGGLDELLFPVDIREFLTVIANLGLIIFMFIVGLELDPALIKGKERVAGVISLSSIVLPMTLGVGLAFYLHDGHKIVDGAEVPFTPFALFIGASMSITAFPVLARIMLDRGMYRTQIGALTLACAAVDDVLAWSLVAVVLAVIETGTFVTWDFPKIIGLSIAFGAVMGLVVRPLLKRLVPAYEKAGRLTPNIAAVVLVGFLVSSFVTSEIGVHHILGAFTFGAIMPKEGAHALNLEILERFEQLTVLLLLPVFFVTTGLAVDIGALEAGDIGTLVLIMLTACVGKFMGATAAASLQGIRPWRRAAAIGTLMNTRGLTELIILTIGRTEGVLDDRLFTLLVIMAVATTVITEPGLRLFYPDRLLARDVAEAQRASLGLPDAYRVLVAVDDVAGSEAAVALAADIVGDERPSEVVLSRLVEVDAAPELARGSGARLAEMTASIEAMAALERQVEHTGVEARVLTRFSTELEQDLAGQSLATDTDVLVLVLGDAPHPDAAAMADRVDRVVTTFSPTGGVDPSTRVVLFADDSDHAVAAFDLAVRVARTRRWELAIVCGDGGRRRWEAVVAPLTAAGLAVRLTDRAEPGGLLVAAGATTSPDGALLRAFAPPDFGRSPADVVEAFVARTTAATTGGADAITDAT